MILNIKVNDKITSNLHNLYSEWLMDYVPEEICSSDCLIKLEENQTNAKEFLQWVEENI